MKVLALLFILSALLFIIGCGAAAKPIAPTPTNEMQGAPLPPVTMPVAETTTTITTTTVYAPAPPVTVPAAVPGVDRWDRLAECETGGNWSANTGNGFGGGLQFAHGSGWSTWLSYGGGEFAANPWDASREQQIVVAENVLASVGWRAWPGCSRLNGWR